MTLTEIKTAFEGCPASAEAVNRNIRELSAIIKRIDRIKFECGYRKDGWFLGTMIECDPDYKDVVRHLKRLKWLKKAWKGEVGEGMDIEKARSVKFEDVHEWQKIRQRPGGFFALCPLHDDRVVGSFNVFTRQGQQWFKCFACSKQGDIISFTMALHGIGFKEAVGRLNAC